MNVKNFERDVKINRFKLEEESEKQPSIYFYYANELAELKKKKDSLENKLNLLLSETELSIRDNPPVETKITESLIKSLVEKDQYVHHMKKKLVDVKGDIYVYTALVTALEQRNSQLKVLKDLFIANYFTVDDQKRTFEGSDNVRKKLNKKIEENKS